MKLNIFYEFPMVVKVNFHGGKNHFPRWLKINFPKLLEINFHGGKNQFTRW